MIILSDWLRTQEAFATASRRTPPNFTLPFSRCRYCRTPPAHRCPQRRHQQRQQRQRVTEGTAMAPKNGPNNRNCNVCSSEKFRLLKSGRNWRLSLKWARRDVDDKRRCALWCVMMMPAAVTSSRPWPADDHAQGRAQEFHLKGLPFIDRIYTYLYIFIYTPK